MKAKTTVEDTLNLQTEKSIHLYVETSEKIISPAMRLDARVGVLVVELKKISHD